MNRDQLDTQFDMIWYIFSHEASEPNLWLGQTVWARNIAGLKIRASNPTRTFGMPPGPTGRLFGPSPKAKRARLRFDKSTDHRSWTSPSFNLILTILTILMILMLSEAQCLLAGFRMFRWSADFQWKYTCLARRWILCLERTSWDWEAIESATGIRSDRDI